MENEGRKISKIARELNKLVLKMTKEDGIGSSEIDLIHLVRHNPGISQKEVGEKLNVDKGAIAKRVVSLEKKGYIYRENDVNDKRKHYLYALPKAESLKNTKVDIENIFYDWLFLDLDEKEKEMFLDTLDKLYQKSKKESRNNFINISKKFK
jgi:DNA-binding MarR family transcriptional regulator